jgi:hypothetical protein
MLKGTFGKRGGILFAKTKQSKYNAVKCQLDGINFDSLSERRYYSVLKLRQEGEEITALKIHPRYPIIINDIKVCDVELDFEYYDKADKTVHYVDVKGKDTDMSRLKRKMIEAEYDIKVEIVRSR